MIHVGDCGEGFADWKTTTTKRVNGHFSSLGIEYLRIRDNHSDPAFFDGRVMLWNFKLLRDYTTLHLNGQSWLFRLFLRSRWRGRHPYHAGTFSAARTAADQAAGGVTLGAGRGSG